MNTLEEQIELEAAAAQADTVVPEATAENVALRTALALERIAQALEHVAYSCETGAMGGNAQTGAQQPMTVGMMLAAVAQQLQALVHLEQQKQQQPPIVGGPRMPPRGGGRW